MARRKGPVTRVDPSAFDSAGAKVIDNSLTTEIEDSYLEYAYSVIHSRALPDARDGLKPVHRRILFSMNEQNHRPTSPYVKSSRVVGDCFVRGALVSTPSGVRPIEEIVVGDHVLDPAGAPVRVAQVYENPVSELVRVTFSDGRTILVTPGQRFRVHAAGDAGAAGVEWVAARDLVGRHAVAFGPGRASALLGEGDQYAHVLGLLASAGVDGQRLRLTDEGPADAVHGWAIAANVAVTRDKLPAEGPGGRDVHVLDLDGHVGVRAAVASGAAPAAVLLQRGRWAAFLAGVFDGAGSVRDGEVVLGVRTALLAEQVGALLADCGLPATRADGEIRLSGGAAATLGAVLLPWARSDAEQDLRELTGASQAPAPEVVSVEPVAPDTTYDIQVDADEHAFVVDGLVVHNCMGKYHPHGDTAIYDAMVRLAQDFSLNTPLIDGHGNFGSPDDGPAASRYTEARMSGAAMLLVGELDEDTVEFRPNYDGSLTEPAVLPAAFPNLLVNGTSGIAVGMATNMIPHNLGEVVAAARHLVKHPDADLEKLMEFIPGPDLPTGGMLLGLDEVRKAYETGRGVVRMRATVTTGPLEGSRGRQAITVTELPYGVGPEKIIEKITDEVNKSKRLTGIADVKDLTDRENGIRLVIECKVGVNPQALLADLYRLTPLEQSFGINNLVLVDGQPQTLGLKALLEVFLAHRYEVVTRRTRFRRRKREDRLHLVDGLLKALIDIDKVIKLIRRSENAQAAKEGLVSTFALSETQAAYILDTPLRRLTRFDSVELEGEQERLRGEIAELSTILDDDKVLRRVVSNELGKVAKDLSAERRTTLLDGDLKEVLAASRTSGPLEVADDPCQVVLSATGLVARTAAESEEAVEGRKRSGRAKHDAVAATVHTTARGQVLLVTSRGRAFKTDVLPLPVLPQGEGTLSLSGGVPVRELVGLEAGERVVGIAPLGETDSPGLALGTKQGVVKVCAPEWPVRSDEFEVIGLKAGDEVVGAQWLADGQEALVFVSSEASLLRYAASLVRPQGLRGGGMAGITLPGEASVVFFGAVRTDDAEHGEPVVVTSTGQSVKVTPFDLYPAKGRATGGVRAHRFLKGEDGLVLAWVGARPAAVTESGAAVELPEIDPRRDGSGAPHPGPDVIGHLVERA
ncbi:DNA topoisomerase (ATP-hydrolyzing) [Actinosynnema mirum]|uniref:DNA gyrase subunit A n=1 Tax=Actinosynnema mirum (strain ATCC 29888 / DSM 43827 / JCM 3225 / NBRC 14064 / NCIMB 13271 / NRRL B-12336 / IMRU 3971 / 101) TaxID=446462 RepID=C6WIH8_ACTMD|nr:DNA topoisomerase (ATP-hydrolyzing) [Actinosynnema mirum]ACU36221.1 DNA topoisomerase (ATP-hydrolyzing) [Actinosynnema mirum DSM 43827]